MALALGAPRATAWALRFEGGLNESLQGILQSFVLCSVLVLLAHTLKLNISRRHRRCAPPNPAQLSLQGQRLGMALLRWARGALAPLAQHIDATNSLGKCIALICMPPEPRASMAQLHQLALPANTPCARHPPASMHLPNMHPMHRSAGSNT